MAFVSPGHGLVPSGLPGPNVVQTHQVSYPVLAAGYTLMHKLTVDAWTPIGFVADSVCGGIIHRLGLTSCPLSRGKVISPGDTGVSAAIDKAVILLNDQPYQPTLCLCLCQEAPARAVFVI